MHLPVRMIMGERNFDDCRRSKQSIYRWRGGKAEQFIELSKDNNPFMKIRN
jgi:hypothetical protein